MKPGQIFFIEEEKGKPYRPYLFFKDFKNSAGVIYNILCAPITTKSTVGSEYLIEVNSEALRSPSYVKLINLTTLPTKGLKYRVDGFINPEDFDKVINKLHNIFGYEKRKT